MLAAKSFCATAGFSVAGRILNAFLAGVNSAAIVSQGPSVLHNNKPAGAHSRVCARQSFLILVLKEGLSRLRDLLKDSEGEGSPRVAAVSHASGLNRGILIRSIQRDSRPPLTPAYRPLPARAAAAPVAGPSPLGSRSCAEQAAGQIPLQLHMVSDWASLLLGNEGALCPPGPGFTR